MASIKDVAKHAGVGVGTVSRVLNNTGYVAPDTRDRIEAAMMELDYHPNEMARNLFRNRTNIIGFLIPDIAHPFFGLVARHLEMELYDKGYKTLICNITQKSTREREFLDMLRRHMMDGIVMGAHSLDIEEYEKIPDPIVGFDRVLGNNIPCIASDHKKGGRLAAERLIKEGRKHLLQLAGTKTVTTPSLERHQEFERICREYGVKIDSVEMPWNDFDFKSYLYIAEDIYEEYPHVDGIFSTDMVASACLRAYAKHGAHIPTDVSIIGYDGSLITETASLRLTCIVQNTPRIAQQLAETICALVKKQPVTLHQQIDVYLREGDTTLPQL